MGKILVRNREQNEEEACTGLIGDLAGCISIKRPKEVSAICLILSKSLQPYRYMREAAATALLEFVRFSDCIGSILEHMVEGLCRHVSDVSPIVRRLCLRGLVQVVQYISNLMVHDATWTTSFLCPTIVYLSDRLFYSDPSYKACIECIFYNYIWKIKVVR